MKNSIFVLFFLIVCNVLFSQTKNDQINTLTSRIDSFTQAISIIRNAEITCNQERNNYQGKYNDCIVNIKKLESELTLSNNELKKIIRFNDSLSKQAELLPHIEYFSYKDEVGFEFKIPKLIIHSSPKLCREVNDKVLDQLKLLLDWEGAGIGNAMIEKETNEYFDGYYYSIYVGGPGYHLTHLSFSISIEEINYDEFKGSITTVKYLDDPKRDH